MRLRQSNLLDVSTLSIPSLPSEAQADRPDVPAFTRVNELHFIAKVARNLCIRQLNSVTRHRLSGDTGWDVTRYQWGDPSNKKIHSIYVKLPPLQAKFK